MKIRNPFLQFVFDGLLGIGLALLPLILVSVVSALLFSGGDIITTLGYLLETLFFIDVIPELVPIVVITSFVGTGSGAFLLRKTTSRWSWLLPLLGISLIAWLTAMGVIATSALMYPEPEERAYAAYFLSTYADQSWFGVVIGFMIAGLIGMIFNPASRPIKVLIAWIISAGTGYLFAFIVLVIRVIPT